MLVLWLILVSKVIFGPEKSQINWHLSKITQSFVGDHMRDYTQYLEPDIWQRRKAPQG